MIDNLTEIGNIYSAGSFSQSLSLSISLSLALRGTSAKLTEARTDVVQSMSLSSFPPTNVVNLVPSILFNCSGFVSYIIS